ncbi:hypothetical protein B484DRAFT_399515 [Ochromonadaceae sp. CCMP2298]|nr:hypothetical protein B484DRAFT_399515 [Ochromonadaceae sp. CCMP2298]
MSHGMELSHGDAADQSDAAALAYRMALLDMPNAPTHTVIDEDADDSDNYDDDYDPMEKRKRKVKVSSVSSSSRGRVYFSKSKKNTIRVLETLKLMVSEGKPDEEKLAYFMSEINYKPQAELISMLADIDKLSVDADVCTNSNASAKARMIKNGAADKYWVKFYANLANINSVTALTTETDNMISEINRFEANIQQMKNAFQSHYE